MADHHHRKLLFAFLLSLLVLPIVTGRAQNNPVQNLSKPYQKWLDEDVRYIITGQERADFNKLTTDQQRDKFVVAFWERRNPNPGAEENKFKEEHYRRMAYVNEQFAAGAPGWKTDRGRIYILYGPPDEREQHPGGTGSSTPATAPVRQRFPSDVWRYHFIKGIGHDVFFVFLDKCGCGKYELQEDPFEERSPSGNESWLPVSTAFLQTWGKSLSEDVRFVKCVLIGTGTAILSIANRSETQLSQYPQYLNDPNPR